MGRTHPPVSERYGKGRGTRGTNHTAGSPPFADATTRTPPGAGSTRKRQPCNSPSTVQPPEAAAPCSSFLAG